MKKSTIMIIIFAIIIGVSACIWYINSKNQKSGNQNSSNQIKTLKKLESISTNKPNENSIESGLLLGLTQDEDANTDIFKKKGNSYRTLWIYPDNNGIAFIEKKDMIITPYGDKFWRLENSPFGMKTEPEEIYGNSNDNFSKYSSYYNYINIVGFTLDQKSLPLLDNEKFRNKYLSEPEGTMGQSYMANIDKLLYVGNRFVCVSTDYLHTGGGSFSAWGEKINWYEIKDLRNINRMNKSLEVLGLLDDKLISKMEDLKKNNRLPNQGNKMVNEDQVVDPKVFGLNHSNGRWNTQVLEYNEYQHNGNGSNGSRIVKQITLTENLPKSLTSYDELCIPWHEVKKKVPGAKDAVSSPEKDLLLVLTDDKLLVFINPMNGINNWTAAAPIAKGERIILNQWATGDYVGEWTKKLVQ